MSAGLTNQPAQGRAVRVHFAATLCVALVLRLVVVSIVLFVYPRDWIFHKAPDLFFLAQSLVSGHGFGSPFGGFTGPSAFLAPGYPFLLAVLFRLFGSYSMGTSAAMVALQTLFALLTIAVLMHIAKRRMNARVANLGGVIWAVSPVLLWLPVVPWETSLSILLLTGMVALALQCVKKPGNAFWLTTGAYCGAAMLVNPSLTLALSAMLGWTLYQTRADERSYPWLCVVGVLLIFSPWPLRNARVLHAFIPLRSNFGYELWQGNHEGATGMFDANIEPLKNKREYAAYAAEGEVAYMGEKSALARNYIRRHPGKFIERCAMRTVRFWTGAGSQQNSFAVECHASVISLFGLAGLIGLFRRDRALAVLFMLPLLLFPLPYYLTHPDFRFRLVLDPLLTILTAYVWVALRTRIFGGSRT